jgi:hypothetical protein
MSWEDRIRARGDRLRGGVTRKPYPGPRWLLGLVIAAVVAGGVAAAISEDRRPIVETTIKDVEVLPENQAEISGHLEAFVADDATGPPITLPIEVGTGSATIEGVIVDGQAASIVWDGGRPLLISGTGILDLGPAHVELGPGIVSWSMDGLRVLTPGEYRIDTPVAIGSAGLARPRDSVTFTATDNTTITTEGGAVAARPLPVHLEGPGSFRADGTFDVRTRDGTATATHLEFGPGPFVADLAADGTFTAVVNGDLVSG